MQALLCGILYWLAEANVPYVTIWTLQKPLICGWLTGCILGAPAEGAFCGALISLLYIGHKSQGSSMPADIALAGICAAAACCAGASAGVSVFYALPAGLFGILIWRLRLFVNARFMLDTEKSIETGQTWGIMIPAVLVPVLFSAAVCIPVGATFSFISYAIAYHFAGSVIAAGSVLQILAPAGLIICTAGLVIPLFPVRDKRAAAAFVIGTIIAAVLRVPLLLFLVPAILVSYTYVRAMEKRPAAVSPGRSSDPDFGQAAPADFVDPDFDPGLDPDFDPDFDSDLDPDFDPDFDPDLDPDFDPDFDPDPDPVESSSIKKSAAALRSNNNPIPVHSLAACNLLWILFVQAAYNTKLMMGQAAAVAFVPIAKSLCPNDPQRQKQLLQRQCVYLNTQPELGSCLIGRLASMETLEADDERVRTVRSSFMGIFGALGDELFQCGWIPLLLLLACDLVLRGRNALACVLLYVCAAVVSAALLSAISFRGGFFHDEMEILDLLESSLFHRIRHALDLLLPFLRGAALGTLLIRILLPAIGVL